MWTSAIILAALLLASMAIVLFGVATQRLIRARLLHRRAYASAIPAADYAQFTIPPAPEPAETFMPTMLAAMQSTSVFCKACYWVHQEDQCPLQDAPEGARWCDRCRAVHERLERCPLWGEDIVLCQFCHDVFTCDSRGCDACRTARRHRK